MESNNLIDQEYEKCKNSSYYFAINYIKIKNEKDEYVNFTTRLNEEELKINLEVMKKNGKIY